MKNTYLLALTLVFFSYLPAQAQYLFNFGIDVYKTDNRNPVEFVRKAQFSAELNYFLIRQLSLTLGIEAWTDQGVFFLPGARFYPVDPFFLRFRPLVGREVDYALGFGYGRQLTGPWRLEVMTDYYFENSDLALRVGVGYKL